MTNGNFPLRLKEAMERKGVNGRQLAERTQVTEATVSRYLSGARNPENFEILASIARFLEVSTDYLLDFQSGRTFSHIEDEVLRIFRSMTSEQQVIYVEQGKAVVRLNQKEKEAKSS